MVDCLMSRANRDVHGFKSNNATAIDRQKFTKLNLWVWTKLYLLLVVIFVVMTHLASLGGIFRLQVSM